MSRASRSVINPWFVDKIAIPMPPRTRGTPSAFEYTRRPGRDTRFNPEIGEGLLAGALRALKESGVKDERITVVTVPGALESPLALQRLAQTDDYDALVALGLKETAPRLVGASAGQTRLAT